MKRFFFAVFLIFLVNVFVFSSGKADSSKDFFFEEEKTGFVSEDFFVENLLPVEKKSIAPESSFGSSVELSVESSIFVKSSIPEGAVYLNGVFQGNTPLRIQNLLPGEYLLEVRIGDFSKKANISAKKGYESIYFIEFPQE